MVSFFYFGENINFINHWSHHENYKVNVIFKCFYNTSIFLAEDDKKAQSQNRLGY